MESKNKEEIKQNVIESPFSEAMRRFRQYSLAKYGIVGILFLLFIALAAPFLANGRPLLMYVNGDISFPFLRFMFAPDTTEILVEQFFNYILLSTPILLFYYFCRKLKHKNIVRSLTITAGVLLFIPFFTTHSRLEKSDWRKKAEALKGDDFAIFAPVPYGPSETVSAPYELPSRQHLFGTDKIGRDVLSRMIYGARVSLAVGIFATGITIILGIIIGLISGYFGGKTDFIIMRIVEIVICFPTFLLLLILMSYMMTMKMTQSILIVIAVIGFTGWTGLTRIIRGETLKLRNLAFIQACEALAVPKWRIMLYHLLPNLIGPIMISFTFGIAGAMLAESSLSFLGFGVQDPTASWGELMRQSFEDPKNYWHLTLFPGLALFIAVLSFNFAGEGLRKALDPKDS